jgi:hypothetical protein
LRIELDRYHAHYQELPRDHGDIMLMFEKRLAVAGDWMLLAQYRGEVVGFISAQPTNQEPGEFTSWEQSTDHGTLGSTYEPEGRNVYVVNLDVLRQGTAVGAQYKLMTALGVKVLQKGKQQVIFSSRLPGFRDWLNKHKPDWQSLPASKLDRLAQDYSRLRTLKNGRSELQDRLLRFYDQAGFKQVKVVPGGFKDPASLDYAVLCTGSNPLPEWLRLAPVNWIASQVFRAISTRPNLMRWFVG